MNNRTEHLLTALLVAGFALAITACDGKGPAPRPSAPQPQVRLEGFVEDSARRPILGARVEAVAVDGRRVSTISGFNGFALTGTFDDSTLVRATKDGYLPATRQLGPQCATCDSVRRFTLYLAGLTLPVDPAGDYAVTFEADQACTGIPAHLRSRRYLARIALAARADAPDRTSFVVTLSGEHVQPHTNSFDLFVAGTDVRLVLTDHDYPYVIERVAPDAFLTFAGTGQGAAADVSRFSAAFQGAVEYCTFAAEPQSMERCASAGPLSHARCESAAHLVTFTRR
jgi:hypothetical protein